MWSERESTGIWYSVPFVTAVLRLYLGHRSLVWWQLGLLPCCFPLYSLPDSS